MKIPRFFVQPIIPFFLIFLSSFSFAFDGNGADVNFQPMDGVSPVVKLNQYKGKYVELLLPDDWEAALSPEERRIIIDRADITYQYYSEIFEVEPPFHSTRDHANLLRMAVHPYVGPRALAWLGEKELEIRSSADNLALFKDDLARGLETNRRIIVHEMGHNFDVYRNYLTYDTTTSCDMGGKWCHAWTNIWDAFIPFYGRVVGIQEEVPNPPLFLTADSHQRWWTNHSFMPYYNNTSANWNNAVKSEGFIGATPQITARDSWAGIVDRYVQLYGVEAIKGSMKYLKNYAAANPAPATPEEKEHLRILALASGAKANLSCFLDEWRWYSSAALRNEMQLLYGAPENNNFCKDNDWDGYTPLQGDCNDAEFATNPGASENTNGLDDNCNGYVDDLAGPVEPAVPLAPWAELAPAAKQGNNFMLRATTLTLDAPIVSETPTKIRFWVTGVGVVGTIPYTQDAFYLWTPPANLAAGTYGYRAQLMTDTKPVSDFTPLKWFALGDPCTPNTYDAETMFHSAGNAYTQGWNLHSNGYISFMHNFTSGMQQLTVKAAGQNGAGWPNMRITVGGVQVFNGQVTSPQWSDYTFSFFAPLGTAEVRIEFNNDYFLQIPGQPSIDRNLLLEKVTIAEPCGIPLPINLGPVHNETKFTFSGNLSSVINQLTFNNWTPGQIVVGIGHTDAFPLNGVSVRVNGGMPIALSGDWQTINIPYTGQSVINLTFSSTTTRAIRTQWWAQ
jgi:Ca-dependent carbohydrate-binding module xylan-binding/Putative metal-binding motif